MYLTEVIPDPRDVLAWLDLEPPLTPGLQRAAGAETASSRNDGLELRDEQFSTAASDMRQASDGEIWQERQLRDQGTGGRAVTRAGDQAHGTAVAGRAWPYAGLTLGGGVSVAANIAHSYVPPTAAAPGWTPSPGAVLLAAFWPAAVFVAVEIMARASWAAGRRWVLVRWGGLAPVALVAAVVSYRHLAGLLGYYGEDPVTVAIGPLAVDGLMIVSTGALLAMSPRPLPAVDLRQPTSVPATAHPIDRLDPVDRVESTRQGDRVEYDVQPESTPPESPGGLDLEPIDLRASAAAVVDERALPARVVALLDTTLGPGPTSEVDHRPEDVERLKAAVMAGDISWPIKYEPARKHLRINIKYVKAAAQQISNEGWTPGQDELLST